MAWLNLTYALIEAGAQYGARFASRVWSHKSTILKWSKAGFTVGQTVHPIALALGLARAVTQRGRTPTVLLGIEEGGPHRGRPPRLFTEWPVGGAQKVFMSRSRTGIVRPIDRAVPSIRPRPDRAHGLRVVRGSA